MKTKRSFVWKTGIIAVMLSIGLLLSLSNLAYSQNFDGHRGQGHPGARAGDHHGPFAPNLTEEQRQTLRQTVEQLREQGATPNEIHDAVSQLFEQWGIEKPEMGAFMGPRLGFENRGEHPQLTDEQRQMLRDTIQKMRQEGASREEIHQAVSDLFSQWGIEQPAMHNGPRDKHRLIGKWLMKNLNEEQRETLKTKLQELREQGASPEEIHDAIAALFTEWGIEMPERPGPFANLTQEQREIVQAKIQELRDQGASREEIHDAVAALFAEWGVELPEHPGPNSALLTDEQKETLHARIMELKDQGASREEIRDAVNELFKEWGIERPAKHFGRKDQRRGMFGKWLKEKLTPEQQQTLRETIRNLKDQGASREEIRKAVDELLEQWGIERPGNENEEPESSSINSEQIEANNYPNPFNPTTQIAYTVPKDAYVTISVYNAQGQFIKTIVNRYQNAGNYSVTWDGRDANGNLVPSGMYFYRIIAGDLTLSKRMVLMK